MERVISPEERMRRAEEIYFRRREQGTRVAQTSVSVSNGKKISIKKKMIIQICICVLIYSCFSVLKNYNNIFSQNIISKTKYFLSYDVNFQKMYFQGVEYFKSKFNNNVNDDVNVQETENQEEQQVQTVENIEEQTKEDKNENSENEQDGIGGGSDVSMNNEEGINDGTLKAKVDAENLTQMEQDVDFINQNYSFIHPIEGSITSGFGLREQTEIISAFHQGIDIGASSGTPIKSAISGTVVSSSFAGDYGNHIKIQNGDILTVYAHCSELEVNVGEEVEQGQEIAKVGATGKVTGPHLHFEIRRDGRYVDPQMILKF